MLKTHSKCTRTVFVNCFLAISLSLSMIPFGAFSEMAFASMPDGHMNQNDNAAISDSESQEDQESPISSSGLADESDESGSKANEPQLESVAETDVKEADATSSEDEIEDDRLIAQEDNANSFRFVNGELIHSNEGADPANDSTKNGVQAFSLTWHPDGYQVFDSFDVFTKGHCVGSGYLKGIDVSVHQGDIDWSSVKASGIDFAIIRCGYGNNSEGGNILYGQDDTKWAANVKGCIDNGIPFGVYIYSYATNTSMAKNEADHVLRLLGEQKLSPKSVAFPIYLDMEDSSTVSSRGAFPSIATTFCNEIKRYGYDAGVYSGKSFWENYLTDGCFDQWPKWVAQYNATHGLTYNKANDFSSKQMTWQFSDYGNIPGIDHPVDLNYSSYHGAISQYELYSAVFDPEYYAANHKDVVRVYGDAPHLLFYHFINWGMAEGRQGSSAFDVASYYNANPDLRRAFGANLKALYSHYISYGKAEGRTCKGVPQMQGLASTYAGTNWSSVYDASYYRDRYGDLRSAFTRKAGMLSLLDDQALLAHFVNNGMAEGRQGSSAFDVASYYNANPDLRRAFGANLKALYSHYISYGKAEGRTCKGVPQMQGLASTYAGTNWSSVYDASYYRDRYGDLRSAFTRKAGMLSLLDDQALLAHFVNNGMAEGRQGSASFNVQSYKARYSDLRSAFGNNTKAYYVHYLEFGKSEGRLAS